MPRARGQHDDVTGLRGNHYPIVSAELRGHLAAVDTEHLVRIAVKVMNDQFNTPATRRIAGLIFLSL